MVTIKIFRQKKFQEPLLRNLEKASDEIYREIPEKLIDMLERFEMPMSKRATSVMLLYIVKNKISGTS